MIKRFPLLVALLACALTAVAQDNPVPNFVVQAVTGSEFAIIKTADMTTREGFTFSGGDYSKRVKLQHVAVLVRHPQGSFLFDSGLGKKVDEQVKSDMPFWSRPFASHGAVTPARTQIDGAGLPLPSRIILSHAHWDHASGLVDFPESDVWVTHRTRARCSGAGWDRLFSEICEVDRRRSRAKEGAAARLLRGHP